MTYCLGMLCRSGAVFLSDSRTSAGMDNITMRSKMRIFEKPGERVICIMSSGNLSLTQATLAMIDEDLVLGDGDPKKKHIMNRQTLYETVRYVGSKVRAVEKRDRIALEADGFTVVCADGRFKVTRVQPADGKKIEAGEWAKSANLAVKARFS